MCGTYPTFETEDTRLGMLQIGTALEISQSIHKMNCSIKALQFSNSAYTFETDHFIYIL